MLVVWLNMNSRKYFTIGSSFVIIIIVIMIKSFSNSVPSEYKLNNSTSYIRLIGTSTLHDWEGEAGKISGSLNAEIENRQILKFTTLEIEVTAESIKTDKNKMDANMYKALKTETYPKISFKLKDHFIDKSVITITGDLTVAGVTKSIKTKTDVAVIGNELQLSGDFNVKMTDFKIKPPVMFFGTLKTADMVKLKFLLVFKKSTN